MLSNHLVLSDPFSFCLHSFPAFSLVAQLVKNLPAMQETQVQPPGWEDPLEKEMATHSSTLAQGVPSQRVGRNCTTNSHFSQYQSFPMSRLFTSGGQSIGACPVCTSNGTCPELSRHTMASPFPIFAYFPLFSVSTSDTTFCLVIHASFSLINYPSQN